MQVVARFLDGRMVKGDTTDFHPRRDSFHVKEGPENPVTLVSTSYLKALFFVRTLEGNHKHQDHKQFPDSQGIRTKVWVQFTDGEELAGWPVSLSIGEGGFYLLPTDPQSNIEKMYVWPHSLEKVFVGDEAGRAARRYVRKQRPGSEHYLAGLDALDLV